ncbi:MFS transporter [Nonomuraea sp. NPDC001831]|uniref:MFS transporter n=1 Tax=Nonomuraea sp. NPDC001831 TaxID=3364340 RepID=UPI0036C96D20
MAVIEAQRVGTRRAGPAVAAAGVSSFALLYAPQPVLPQLAADFRLDPGGASLAVGVATAALAVAVLPLAALAEVVGRRRMIVWSVLASALIGLALPLAPTFPVLVAMRAAQGVAVAGFAGVGAAYLADLVGATRLAGAVGVMIAGNSVGGMLGRLGAGFAAGPWGWRGALLVVAGGSLLCSAYAARTLPTPEPAPPPTPEPTPAPAPESAGRAPRAGGGGRIGTALLAPYTVGALGVGAFVALYNAASFRLSAPPLSLSPAAASLVFLSYALGTASSAAAGRLADRLGRRAALVAALAVTAAGSALTALGPLAAVVTGFAVLTAGFFAAHAVANAWVAAQAPPAARGRAAGIYTLCYYLGSGAGGTAGSAVYGHAGWTWLIVLTSAWLLLAIVAVLAAGRRARAVARRPRQEYA